MNNHQLHRTQSIRLTAAALFSLSALGSSAAWAFAEDICPRADGGWTRCNLSPCSPTGGHFCSAVSFITTVATAATPGSRSTLHFDSTYYMAQAIGFSPRDAYTIAAADDATDLTQMVLYDRKGKPMADFASCAASINAAAECQLISPMLGGVSRTNFAGGGMLYHFTLMPQDAMHDNGMDPPLNDALAEPLLAHMRRWALNQGPLCVGGITNQSPKGDYATGDSCFQSSARPTSTLLARLPIVSWLGPITSLDWIIPMGEQTVMTDPATGELTPASQMGNYLPADTLQLTKLAVYLHVVSDRVSHHRCADASVGQGPRPADARDVLMNPIPYNLLNSMAADNSTEDGAPVGVDQVNLGASDFKVNPDFLWQYATLECGQPQHAERHTYETGTKQSTLNPEDRTAQPALAKTYDAMLEFARYYHVPGSIKLTSADRKTVIDALMSAEQVRDPGERLDALTRTAQQHHWLPLPGYGLSFGQWDAQAGNHFFDSAPVKP